MGTWHSDGVFGFCAVPVSLLEKAAKTIEDPTLAGAVQSLKRRDDRTQPFIEMMRVYGPALVQKIAASYREYIAHTYARRSQSAGA